MFLSAFRQSVRTRAFALLLSVAVCAATVDWGHTGWDDPACDPVPVLHSHSAHHLTGGGETSDAPADHCSLCHFLRLLHTALSLKSLPASELWQTAERRTPATAVALALLAFNVPSRAPPVRRG